MTEHADNAAQSVESQTLLMRATPKTKRLRAVDAKLIREGRCRLCGHSHRPLTRHHLVPIRWKRRNSFSGLADQHKRLTVAANIIPLCDTCHKLVEAKIKGGGLVHRARLRASLLPEETTFAVKRAGQEWLDLNYPLAVESR